MKNKTKKGGSCSIFGRSKKKDKTNKLQEIVKDLPDGVTNQLIFLLSKDSNIITSTLRALNLEELEKEYTKNDDVLMTEIRGQVTPEKKVLKFIEVRRKQLDEIKDPMVYSTQEKSLIMEELNKLDRIFNASTSVNVIASAIPASANVTASALAYESATSASAKPTSALSNESANKSASAKELNESATAKPANAKPANAKPTSESRRAIETFVTNSSTGKNLPISRVANLLSSKVKEQKS